MCRVAWNRRHFGRDPSSGWCLPETPPHQSEGLDPKCPVSIQSCVHNVSVWSAIVKGLTVF